jgi:signal peptidase I
MNQIKPRKPLLAACMSLILPGFGQLYNGDANRGLFVFIAFSLATIPLVLWVSLGLPSSMTLVLLLLTILINGGIWIYAIVNAWKSAKKAEYYEVKDWQLPAVYTIIFLSAVFYISPSISEYMRANLLESFEVPSTAMSPSLLPGDVLFSNKNYNCIGCAHAAQRGDIAIFVYPNDRTIYYIKRIIGLPGDRISIKDKQIFVNSMPLSVGTPQQEGNMTLITEKAGNIEYRVQWNKRYDKGMEEFIVPNGEVFLLGDSRSNSKDSRYFGTVPLQDVVGKASQIWMSNGEEGLRWDRFGLVLE